MGTYNDKKVVKITLHHLVKPYYVQEKAMAPHFSTLAWKIPWMEEPGKLQSMGSPRVGHDFTLLCAEHQQTLNRLCSL